VLNILLHIKIFIANENLDVIKLLQLERLSCSENGITDIDLSNITKLTHLSVYLSQLDLVNSLTSLNVSVCENQSTQIVKIINYLVYCCN
jgi:Leucine-rich repeat (LRR) protein